MKTPLTPLLLAQRTTYALRYACEDCAHFDEPRERCVHSYPTEAHRKAADAPPAAHIVFCKEFELA